MTGAAQLRVVARGLADGALHDEDVGDLRADVEVEKLERVRHAGVLDQLRGLEDLRGREAKFGLFT